MRAKVVDEAMHVLEIGNHLGMDVTANEMELAEKNVSEVADDMLPNVFDEALHEVLKLLRLDVWPRFCEELQGGIGTKH